MWVRNTIVEPAAAAAGFVLGAKAGLSAKHHKKM